MAYFFLLTLDFYIALYIFSEEDIHLAPYLSYFYGLVEDLNYTNMQIRFPYISRGVYSQEFVANKVKKSWSWSYKLIFLVILHIKIEEFNYRLLIMLK